MEKNERFEEIIKDSLGEENFYGETKKVAKNFVDGNWVPKPNSNQWPDRIISPINGNTVGYIHETNQESMKKAGEAAKKSQKYWYLKVGQQEKENVFRVLREYIQKYRYEIAKTMVLEMGKPIQTADGEVQELLDTIDRYFGELSRIYGRTGPCQAKDKWGMTVKKPYGVIYAITPWNFPLAIPIGWKMIAALAGGNSVVLKPCEQTPFTANIGVSLFYKALKQVLGVQRVDENLGGLVQVIHGTGERTGDWYLRNGYYDCVAFTGGRDTGSHVAEIAGKRIRKCHLELGGHGAIVLFSDFDVDRAVNETLLANTGDSGQRCVSTRVVFAEESVYDEFVGKYIIALKQQRIGDPFDSETKIGPLVNAGQLHHIHNAVQRQGDWNGGKFGGAILNEITISEYRGIWNIGNVDQNGFYYLPTVFLNAPMDSPAMKEEIFGPVLCINKFGGKTKEEKINNAVKLVNATDYGLSNAVLTRDMEIAFKIMEEIETGILYIGRGTTGAELGWPFGGAKRSGFGREGDTVNDDFTYEETVYWDYHDQTRLAQAGAAETLAKKIKKAKSPLE